MGDFLFTIANATFSSILANLAASYVSSKNRSINVPEETIITDLKPHIEVAYNKCIQTKTILNDSPVDFLPLYTDQNFKFQDNFIDQYEMVEFISNQNSSMCITGTGGGGKSMFVRYLWLSLFENPQGRIPFFLELRQLNNSSQGRLEDFIYHSIIKTGSKISQVNFKTAMANGEFILLLDGFDELNIELRDKIEQQIIELKENNPSLTIIVTSRPDDRFSGWHQFHSARVEPLEKKQVISLIKKVTFDEGAKKALLRKISKDGIYESHKSFLSNPLLASMMLVTISYNPDIPFRMFSFYEQAFEALYYRHDLNKNGYQRKLFCPIEKHDLIRILSYFCLVTYYKQAFEFSEVELLQFCEKAIGIEEYKISASDLVKDAIESLCLIKKEGLEYSFTHRTFQEYFAALCLSRVTGKNIEKFLSSFAERYTDQVIGMTYDMNPYLFREKYISPIAEKYPKFFKAEPVDKKIIEYMRSTKGYFRIAYMDEREERKQKNRKGKYEPQFYITHVATGELADFSLNVKRLVDGRENLNNGDLLKLDRAQLKSRRAKDNAFLKPFFETRPDKENTRLEIKLFRGKLAFILNGKNISSAELQTAFKKTPMYDFLARETIRIQEFVDRELKTFGSVSNKIDDLI